MMTYKNPREEQCKVFVSAEDIPLPYVRRLMRLLVVRCGLPIPLERVDEFVEWHRHNQGWLFSDEDHAEAKRLRTVV